VLGNDEPEMNEKAEGESMKSRRSRSEADRWEAGLSEYV